MSQFLELFYNNITRRVINQDAFQIYRWEHQRDPLQESGQVSAIDRPQMLSDNTLSFLRFKLVEAGGLLRIF